MRPTRSRPIALLDAPWILTDTRRHPMHVAGLFVYQAPESAGPGFVHDVVEDMRRFTVATDPFNRRLWRRGRGRVWPRWETLPSVQLEFQVQRQALPWPGGERELGALVSRLHRAQLDRSRPLWEVHVIEGLEGGRFAIYAKFHHSLVDGVGAIRLLQSALSFDPDERGMPPLWAATARARPADRRGGSAAEPTNRTPWHRAARGAVAALRHHDRVDPYDAPRTALNTAIGSHRRVATHSVDLARVRRVADALGGTINDVLLAMSAGALRRYLAEIDALPHRPLVAAMPVSVRPEDGADTGNAITFGFTSLATDIADVRERTRTGMASTARSKAHLARLPHASSTMYTILTMARFIATQVLGLGARDRPMFNLAISNVPGPREPVYYNGARVLDIYPISVLQSGQALNITALSYADRLDVAITACGSSLPSVQRLALHYADALDELEDTYLAG